MDENKIKINSSEFEKRKIFEENEVYLQIFYRINQVVK
jgi:hypothetical protein